MIGLIKMVQKRPSDLTIRATRIIFGLILIGGGYYNLIHQDGSIENTILWMDASNITVYIEYIIIALGLFPLFLGVSNMCLLQKKHMKRLQLAFAFLIFFAASIIVESASLDYDTLLVLMGFLPLFDGITGKFIPTHCLKYKEKITKIRV